MLMLLSRCISFFRVGLALLFFTVTCLSFILFALITFRYWSDPLSGYFLRFWGRGTLLILGIPLHIDGQWPFETNEPRVVLCNHQSTLDIIWSCAVSPNRLGGLGKKELIWVPLLNLMWWALRLYYIDRKTLESAIKTVDLAGQDAVARKRSIMIAPEGTRSSNGRMGPFKKGPFYLAISHHLPIYGMIVVGAHEAMPKGTAIPYPRPLHVRFLPPFQTTHLTLDDVETCRHEVENQMKQAYHQFRDELGFPDLRS
jgi:1-acyl-sn-glycerol-3-phosphate acyltransferase